MFMPWRGEQSIRTVSLSGCKLQQYTCNAFADLDSCSAGSNVVSVAEDEIMRTLILIRNFIDSFWLIPQRVF